MRVEHFANEMNLNGSLATRNIVSINTSAHVYEIFVLLYICTYIYVSPRVHMPENRAALEFIHQRWAFILGASLDGIFNDAQQVRFYHLQFTI